MKRSRLFCIILLVLIAGIGSLAAPTSIQHPQQVAQAWPQLRPGMQPQDVADQDEIGLWCTSIPVSKEASATNACMTSHSCDGHYEIRIHVVPGGKHGAGTMRAVLKGGGLGADRDPEKKVGEIPEAPLTFTRFDASYPFMNEKGVQIGETTIMGRRELYNTEGWMDIMELERIALERASSAREAIQIMGAMAMQYGYGDYGECLTVIDQNEAWHFEIFGPGPGEKGAVWGAARIPAGHVGVSANRPRLPVMKFDDKDNFMVSPIATKVAEQMGWWKQGEPFNMGKIFGGPVRGYGSTRREWRVLSTFAPSLNLDPWNQDPPFTVKAEKKVTKEDLMALHRDWYEGTEFDSTAGAAGGPYKNPNVISAGAAVPAGSVGFERTISITGCSYVAVHEARNGMPPWIGSVAWFTPDDAKTGNFVPFYAGNTSIPKAYEIGNRAEFDRNSAWWAFDFVGNWSQLRFNGMIQDIKAKRAELEGKFLADQASVEQQALDLYKKDPAAARKFINDYSNKAAQKTIDEWWKLADFLIVKYNDNGVNVRGGQNPPPPSKEWLDSIGFGTRKIPTKPTGAVQ
ncbi:MAG: dipeptidase [Bacteroidales bacterium]